MTTLGYYITCDDALCARCAEAVDLDSTWEGFESWEEPLPIEHWDEADTPTHCKRCEALIPHQLTDDGIEYVREAYRETCADLMAGRSARPCIVRAWVLEYLPPTSHFIAKEWPTRDQYSPKEA